MVSPWSHHGLPMVSPCFLTKSWGFIEVDMWHDVALGRSRKAGKFDVVFDNNVRKLEEIQPVVQGIKAWGAGFVGGLLLGCW